MNTRHVCPISGKDSVVTAGVIAQLHPELNVEYITNITGLELPEFDQWIKKVETFLGKSIVRIDGDLRSVIKRNGILPSHRVRFCTRQSKIEPLERYLSGSESVNVYYGLRYDEPNRTGYQKRGKKTAINPVYPLRDNHIGIEQVWHLGTKWDILPPALIWESIVELTKAHMGEYWRITETLKPWHYQHLFSWRTRQFNCYGCFYMRQYEFIGLHEHYPDLFWEIVEIEESTGADDYTIRESYHLRDLLNRADDIKNKRVDYIRKTLYKLAQKSIFEEVIDDLGLTSCGMFCGK